MREINKISESLFEKIRDRFEDVTLGDENAKATAKPEDARFFNFDYVSNGKNYGNITISLIDEISLKVYFSKNISSKLDDESKKEWYGFLRELREFSRRNLLSFEPRDITRSTLKHRDVQQVSKADSTFSKDELSLVESRLYGSTKSSYEKDGNVRIIVRHSERVDPEKRGARSRKINSIFVENKDGERFKLPYNNLRYARAMARHVSEGGSLMDDFGQHITSIAEESAKLRPFKNGMARRTFEDEETQAMLEAAFSYHAQLNDTLKKMSGRKGYRDCKEQFEHDQPLVEIDADIDSLRERFVRRVFNEKWEEALPIVQKAYEMKKHNQLSQQFESWANSVIDEGMSTGVEELLELFAEEIPVGVDAVNATGTLEGTVIANHEYYDDLVDQLLYLANDPEADARETILNWMQDEMPYQYQAIVNDMGDADVPAEPEEEPLSEGGRYWSNSQLNNYDSLYNELVPGSGKAETLEGELIRAASRINYDLHNNGFGNNWSGALNYLNKYLEADISQETRILDHYARGGDTYDGNFNPDDPVVAAADSLVDKALAQVSAAAGNYHPNPQDMFELQDKDDPYQGEEEYDPYEEEYDQWQRDNDEEDDEVHESKTPQNPLVDKMISMGWSLKKYAGDSKYGTYTFDRNQHVIDVTTGEDGWVGFDDHTTGISGNDPIDEFLIYVEELPQIQPDEEVDEGTYGATGMDEPNVLAEWNIDDEDEHPAKSAIVRRIMLRGTELLGKFGPVQVMQAIDNVCERIPYDLEEIGTSDVSIWVKQVEEELLHMGPEELTENDGLATLLDKVAYKGQVLELEQWADGSRTISNAKTAQVLKSGPAQDISTLWGKIKAAASATAAQMTGGAVGQDIQEGEGEDEDNPFDKGSDAPTPRSDRPHNDPGKHYTGKSKKEELSEIKRLAGLK